MGSKTGTLSFPINLTKSGASLLFTGFSVLSFIVPFSLAGPQWLVGTIVNTCLFLTAVFLPKKFFLPMIVFPSLAVLARGIIFGPLTSFLTYFLPFIWLGNLILILIFRKLCQKAYEKQHYFIAVFLAGSAKFIFLLAIANIYFNFQLVPAAFLQIMGISQLFTALAGGLISLIVFNAFNKQKFNLLS
ncbi:MAG TPA: hypothetical protein VJ378_01540 [Candidatus Paceibacterota bacterium]|nr:hypothetical protein [Candidatus Paceibacterota bacterium]